MRTDFCQGLPPFVQYHAGEIHPAVGCDCCWLSLIPVENSTIWLSHNLFIYPCYCKGMLHYSVWDCYKHSHTDHSCELLLHEPLESPSLPCKGRSAHLPPTVSWLNILGALHLHQYLGLPSHSFCIQLSLSHPGMTPIIPFQMSPGLSHAR